MCKVGNAIFPRCLLPFIFYFSRSSSSTVRAQWTVLQELHSRERFLNVLVRARLFSIRKCERAKRLRASFRRYTPLLFINILAASSSFYPNK